MNSDDISKLIRTTGPYQAEYVPQPIDSKPDSCNIPGLIAGAISLPPLNLPDIDKICAPIFTEFPIVPEPFAVPESCANGISFTTKSVNIYSSLGSIQPSGSVAVGISQDPNNFCNYELNVPDIVIPCFPSGPQFAGTTAITVIDNNSNTSETLEISLNQDPNASCRWLFDGGITINIPEVPCPNGITFTPASLKIHSTCNKPVDRKQVTIVQNQNNKCRYDLNLPDITIPCYPDGPSVHGTFTVTVKDLGNTVSTQSAGFPTQLTGCCDFPLSGNIDIDVPCHDGIQFPPQSWPIKQPVWRDINGNDITPTAIATDYVLQVGASPIGDQCHIGLSLPPVIIPCYPDGIVFKGGVSFRTTDSVVIQDKIDLSNNSPFSVRDSTKPCTWDLDPIIIDLPTPYCPGGFSWHSDITVKANSGMTIPKVAPGAVAGLKRYHTIELAPMSPNLWSTPGVKDCGAMLTGELNLGIAGFALTCSTLAVGNSTVTLSFDQTKPFTPSPYNITLQTLQNGCGFEFANANINIPALVCSNGFKTSNATLKVFTGSNPTPISNTVAITPIDNTQPQCGLQLSGELHLPNSGGGFTHRLWTYIDTYNLGDVVSMVFPEGGRSSWLGQGANNTIPSGQMPGTKKGSDSWQSFAAADETVFHPFKVIQCTETPAGTTAEQLGAVVKVVPRSSLILDSTQQPITIYGLDCPMVLRTGEMIYLEIVFDGSSNNPSNPISVVYAAICKGLNFDEDANGVPSVQNQLFKIVRPADANALSSSTYVTDSISKIIGLDSAGITYLTNKFNTALINVAALTDTRPRQLKAYVPIAKAGPGVDVDDATNLPDTDGIALQYSSTGYILYQSLNHHLKLSPRNDNNVPMLFPEAYVGLSPITNKLTVTGYSGAGVGDQLTSITLVNFTTTSPAIDEVTGQPRVLGTASNNIHAYYTIDGTPPTINTWENRKCFRLDPSNPLTHPPFDAAYAMAISQDCIRSAPFKCDLA